MIKSEALSSQKTKKFSKKSQFLFKVELLFDELTINIFWFLISSILNMQSIE